MLPEPESAELGAWVVAGSRARLESLAPLIAAHGVHRRVRSIELAEGGDAVGLAALPHEALDGAAGLMLVGDAGRAPAEVLPGIFVRDRHGRRLPVGWVPALPGALERFAAAAAEVVARDAVGLPVGPVALLAQFDDRALRVSRRTARIFRAPRFPRRIPIFEWSADRLIRDDMLRALALGPGLAIYAGHGRSAGWLGYHGVRQRHLAQARGRPLGAVASFTCLGAKRNKQVGGISFCEAFVTEGVAAASLGAIRESDHLRNRMWAQGLCVALLEGRAQSLGEALLAALPDEPGLDADYRISGDPLAPLCGAPDVLERGALVFAPAPDVTLEGASALPGIQELGPSSRRDQFGAPHI